MIKLSPSSLNLFFECPRCFWLRFNKRIYRPQTPSSTLPMGVDYTLKNHFDNHRKKGLPPELKGQIDGRLLQDVDTIRRMRGRSFGTQISDDVWFGGALDEAVELADGSIVPLDNKTKGFPPRESHWTHKKQMSGYTLLLAENGFKTKNKAYLIHWYFDHKNMDRKKPLGFKVSVEEIKTNPEEIRTAIEEAAVLLKSDIPQSHSDCEFCRYVESKI